MTAEEALAALKEARETGQGWLRIAEILAEVRDSGVGGSPGKLSVAFIEEAAKASRYAPAILRRMLAALTFLSNFDQAHPQLGFRDRMGGATAQFSKLELFARLHRVAPEKAMEIAGAVADGTLTQKALDLIYREASGRPLPSHLNQDPFGGVPAFPAEPAGKQRKSAKAFPTPFHEACWEALQKDVAKLSGEGDVRLSRDYRFTYFTPFAVAVGVKDFGIEFVDGFYPVAPPFEPRRLQLNWELKEIAFQAMFFRRMWLICREIHIIAMRDAMDSIGLLGVGFAVLDENLLTVNCEAKRVNFCPAQSILANEVLEVGIPKSR